MSKLYNVIVNFGIPYESKGWQNDDFEFICQERTFLSMNFEKASLHMLLRKNVKVFVHHLKYGNRREVKWILNNSSLDNFTSKRLTSNSDKKVLVIMQTLINHSKEDNSTRNSTEID